MVQFLKMQKLTGKDATIILITKWKWFGSHSQMEVVQNIKPSAAGDRRDWAADDHPGDEPDGGADRLERCLRGGCQGCIWKDLDVV
jgi:hypothetical protein